MESATFDALKTDLPIAMLAIMIGAVVWLAKALVASYDARAKEKDTAHDAHLATALQVVPLATKLAACVEAAERLLARSEAK